MSKKQWSALLCLHVAYLFLGASIFYHIESPLELENKLEELRERIEIESKKAIFNILSILQSVHRWKAAAEGCFPLAVNFSDLH